MKIKESYFEDYNANFSVDEVGNLYANIGPNRIKISGAMITEIKMPQIDVNPIYFHGQMINTPIQRDNYIDISLKADRVENIGNAELLKFKLNSIWSNVFN